MFRAGNHPFKSVNILEPLKGLFEGSNGHIAECILEAADGDVSAVSGSQSESAPRSSTMAVTDGAAANLM